MLAGEAAVAEAAAAAEAAFDEKLFGPGGGAGGGRGGDKLPPRALETRPNLSEDEALRRAA